MANYVSLTRPSAVTTVKADLSKYWMGLHQAERLALHAVIYTWAATQTSAGQVLDLGCEYGFGGQLIKATNPTLQVLGLDLDMAAIQYSQNLPFTYWISRINADAASLPIASETLTGVYLINLLHLVKEPGIVLSEVRRTLKAGGVAIMSITWRDAGTIDSNRSRFVQRLETEIGLLFSQAVYPKEISGQIPSYPSQSFQIDQRDGAWIALCRKD